MWKGREGRRKTDFLQYVYYMHFITSRYKLVRAIKWVDEVNNTLYGAGNFRGVKFLWMDHQLTFRGFIFTDERVLPIVSVLDDAKIKPFENFQLYIQVLLPQPSYSFTFFPLSLRTIHVPGIGSRRRSLCHYTGDTGQIRL